MMDTVRGTADPVVLSAESLADDDVRGPVQANVDFVNALLAGLLEPAEISHDALLAYYVDYYLCEVNNGGFSQFVYNSGWNPAVVALVREGLDRIGARQHGELFARGEALVRRKPGRLQAFLASLYFGPNRDRDRLESITGEFLRIEAGESLEALNARWLRERPGLVVVPGARLGEEVSRRLAAIPDLEDRIARARAAEPRYLKLIRALCASCGQSLERVTGADPAAEYAGATVLAWHFITNQGHHFMVERDGRAIMVAGQSGEKVAELPAP